MNVRHMSVSVVRLGPRRGSGATVGIVPKGQGELRAGEMEMWIIDVLGNLQIDPLDVCMVWGLILIGGICRTLIRGYRLDTVSIPSITSLNAGRCMYIITSIHYLYSRSIQNKSWLSIV